MARAEFELRSGRVGEALAVRPKNQRKWAFRYRSLESRLG